MSDVENVVKEIRELKKLVEQGILTEEEFASRKALLLGIDASAGPAASEREERPAAPAAASSYERPAEERTKAGSAKEPAYTGPEQSSPRKKAPVAAIGAAAAVLVLAVLAFTFLGGSKAAREADHLISEIGTISLDSGPAILRAEKAVEALSEEDLKSLKKGDALKQARTDYEKLVDDHKVGEVESLISAIGEVSEDSKEAIDAAGKAYVSLEKRLQSQVENYDVYQKAVSAYDNAIRTRELEAAASQVDELIASIGSKVDENSAAAIEAARKAYDAAGAEIQEKVGSLDALTAAEESLSKLRTGKVEELISGIGEVTKESGALIKAAQDAFKGLSKADQQKVSNQAELNKAVETYQGLYKEEALKKLEGFTKDVDKIEGITWYYPAGWSFYGDLWAADKKSFVLPYIGRDKNDRFWMRIVYDYTGSDWVFFKKITISADGEKFTNYCNYFDVVRDNSGGRVWEYIDENAGESEQKMLRAIGNSAETIVRFEGDDHYRDKTISDGDKKGIRQAMEAYDALREAGFKTE